MRKTATVMVVATVILAATVMEGASARLGGEIPRAQETPIWRKAFDYTVGHGTYWWTSNAAYAAKGEEPPAFGTAWVHGYGGTSVRGCLFAETDGGPVLQWEFFQAWDPEKEALFSWQTQASGGVGVGYSTVAGVGEAATMEQTFAWPGGSELRIRHEAEHVHQDTMITRSFHMVDGDWQPRRTYTWVRRSGSAYDFCPNLSAPDSPE